MNEKLTLQDVTDKLAARIGVTKKVSDDFLREFFSLIVDSLEKDGLVKIKGLGTFKLKSVEERKSVNVQTGAEMIIPAHVKVTYTPDKGLSAEINKPYAHLQTYILDQDGPIEDASFVDDEEQDGDDSEKMDNSIYVNSNESEEESSLGHYYFNDEFVLADQREESLASEETNLPTVSIDDQPIVEDSECSVLSPEEDEKEQVPSILEAQPQEGQTVPVFTEPESVLGTPSINPGPVVTLISDEQLEERAEQLLQSDERIVEEEVEQNGLIDVPNVEEAPAEKSEDNQESVENIDVPESDVESSQSEDVDENVGESVENQENKDLKEDSVENQELADKNNDKRQSTNRVGLLILFLLLLLLGLLGYMFKDELKEAFNFDNKVEEVLPPVVESTNAIAEEEGDSDHEDKIEPQVSVEEEMQHIEEVPSVQQPVVAVEPQSQYSFAPELVQYMKENHPSEDISISSIKDEVKLTSGRRLVDLSLKYYGHKYFWVYIYFFNTDVIKNPNKLVPGTLIKIPELNPSLVDKNSKQKLDMAFEIKKLIEK